MSTTPTTPKVESILTGVKPTQRPHLGNYTGAIRPSLELASQPNTETWFFIADYHTITTTPEPEVLREMTYEVAATWLACGLDPKKTTFYRQSDIPEILELNWILSCVTPKGLMNRAHAYKAKVQENEEAGKKDEDLDDGVNMGLYNYPVLMAADILMFGGAKVPVGEDQSQHLEIARDIAQKFNRQYCKKGQEILRAPKTVVQQAGKALPGLDGRKMSKSYGNHIPLFDDPKVMKKLIGKIKTDSLPPEAPKETEGSIPFMIYEAFASAEQLEEMKQKYAKGIGWGYVKEDLFNLLDEKLRDKREHYNQLMADKKQIDLLLEEGALKARVHSKALLEKVRTAIGISR